MPLYEYACPDCGSTFERLRKHAEREDEASCPDCGSGAAPVFSAAAVRAAGGAGSDPATFHRNAGPGCCGGGACGMN